MVDKPHYKEGDTVRVNSGDTDVFGTIRGCSNMGIVDLYIVEVNPYDLERLPDNKFTCLIAPHVALTRVELIYPDVSKHDPHSVFAQANALASKELTTLKKVVEKKNKEQRKLRVNYLDTLRKELDAKKLRPI